MKRILILGSTGSIGRNVLDVIKNHKDKFKVVGLSAKSNLKLLKKQLEDFDVSHGCIVDTNYKNIRLKKSKILYSEEGLLEIIELTKPDILVNALVGISGLNPLFLSLIHI